MTENIRHQTSDIRASTADLRAMRGHYSFRDLAVWQKSQELSLTVVKLVREMQADRASGVLGQQILRAATSIAANIAEGHGRFTQASYRNHLSIARGSANETLSWIDLLRRSGYVAPEVENELVARCDEVLRMISAQMIALDRASSRRSPPARSTTLRIEHSDV